MYVLLQLCQDYVILWPQFTYLIRREIIKLLAWNYEHWKKKMEYQNT